VIRDAKLKSIVVDFSVVKNPASQAEAGARAGYGGLGERSRLAVRIARRGFRNRRLRSGRIRRLSSNRRLAGAGRPKRVFRQECDIVPVVSRQTWAEWAIRWGSFLREVLVAILLKEVGHAHPASPFHLRPSGQQCVPGDGTRTLDKGRSGDILLPTPPRRRRTMVHFLLRYAPRQAADRGQDVPTRMAHHRRNPRRGIRR
jgi:hypothetical protein